MSGTTICKTALIDDGKITNYTFSRSLMSGHTWTITVSVEHLAWDIFVDDFVVNVSDNDTEEILATTSFSLGYGNEHEKMVTFTGIMPSKDLHLNISLMDSNLIGRNCEDYKEFTIKLVTKPEDEQEKPEPDPGEGSTLIIAIVIGIALIIILVGYLWLR